MWEREQGVDRATRPTREMVREALIEGGNERLQFELCPTHAVRAYLAAAASATNLVIAGCCISFMEQQAREMGFRVDREVKGGRPTLLLSAGLQVLLPSTVDVFALCE